MVHLRTNGTHLLDTLTLHLALTCSPAGTCCEQRTINSFEVIPKVGSEGACCAIFAGTYFPEVSAESCTWEIEDTYTDPAGTCDPSVTSGFCAVEEFNVGEAPGPIITYLYKFWITRVKYVLGLDDGENTPPIQMRLNVFYDVKYTRYNTDTAECVTGEFLDQFAAVTSNDCGGQFEFSVVLAFNDIEGGPGFIRTIFACEFLVPLDAPFR